MDSTSSPTIMEKVIVFDLDDTLSKEIDYLKSAYREIAQYAAAPCEGCSDGVSILVEKAYVAMLEAYQRGENAFEALNAFLGVKNPVSEYLSIYRNHVPDVRLTDVVRDVLGKLKTEGCVIGLITDGRSVQQRHKIEALGLSEFMAEEDIVISEEFGSEKPSLANYEYFMKRYPEASEFVYVGDNPKKDFIAPNALGWTSVCLKDDSRNIHKQDFSLVAAEALPKRVIESLGELISVR